MTMVGGDLTQKERFEIAAKRLGELLGKFDELPPKVQGDFKNVPDSYQRLFLEVHLAEKPQPARAIKLKCLDCCCWQREEVSHCTVKQCGLWKLRPYKEKT